MDLRYTFGENAEDYDRFRPRYCLELFQEIFQYANLKPKASAVEIGPAPDRQRKFFCRRGAKCVRRSFPQKWQRICVKSLRGRQR